MTFCLLFYFEITVGSHELVKNNTDPVYSSSSFPSGNILHTYSTVSGTLTLIQSAHLIHVSPVLHVLICLCVFRMNVFAQSCPTLCDPMDCSPPGSSVYGIFQAIVLECWNGLPFPSPGDLPNPGIEPRSPALQADALPSEPPVCV